MPRQARIDIPGVLQYVTAQAVKSQKIYYSDDDKKDFVIRLQNILNETQTKCYAWTLMPDHFQLLIRPESTALKKIMRRLMTGYAVSFNLRHHRKGQIFKDRYQSIVCEDEPYLLELIRYIHLTPIRDGIAKNINELGNYQWSGFAFHAGINDYPFQLGSNDFEECGICNKSANEVLDLFSNDLKAARKKYIEYLNGGTCKKNILKDFKTLKNKLKDKPDKSKKTDTRVLGQSNFIEEVLKQDNLLKNKKIEKHYPIDEVISKVTSYYEVEIDDMLKGSQKSMVSKARCVICYIQIEKMQRPGSIVGKMMKIKGFSALRCAERGRKILDDDLRLKEVLDINNHEKVFEKSC